MKCRSCFIALLFGASFAGLLGSAPAGARQVGGVQVPDQVSVESHLLILNGAGVRQWLLFDRYVAALYTTMKGLDASTIVHSSEPRSLRLMPLRETDGASLADSFKDSLRDSMGERELAALQEPIRQLADILGTMERCTAGDTIVLNFNGRHLTVFFNDSRLGAVESPGFMTALLQVWLGEQPVQQSLKKALLGL
ncbi:MAG: chalcone isomerase family protein [Burkholderiaceae bacterium]